MSFNTNAMQDEAPANNSMQRTALRCPPLIPSVNTECRNHVLYISCSFD